MASSSKTKARFTEEEANRLADAWEARVLDFVRRNDEEGFNKAQTELYSALVSLSTRYHNILTIIF
jgi:hypothetical protein